MILVATALLLSTFAVQSDESKPAVALYQEGARLEGTDPARALAKFKKAVDKAVAEGNEKIGAKALCGVGRCNEHPSIENIADALAAYERVAAQFAGQPEAAWAADKAKLKGVDVMIRRFAAATGEWRDKGRSSANALEERKLETRTRILPLETAAVPGLIEALGHSDELVRAFAAETLAEVIDEAGIATVIGRLNDKASMSGAALALNKIFAKWKLAKIYDDQAAGIQEDLDKVKVDPLPPQADFLSKPEFQESIEDNRAISVRNPGDKVTLRGRGEVKLTAEMIADAKSFLAHIEEAKKQYENISRDHEEARKTNDRNLARAAELTNKAKEIRHNLPTALNTAEIQGSFASLIGDEKAAPLGRMEAAKCLESIGDLNTALVEAVIAALSSPDRNVRRSACVACGAADTSTTEDKQRLVTRLMEIVQHVTESDVEQKDPANDWFARDAAAEALGKVGTVRAVPALIVALNDPSSEVGERSNLALLAITGKNFGYEARPLVSDPDAKDPDKKMDPKTIELKQLEMRRQAVAKWQGWWDETNGVGAVVDRFYLAAANWKSGDPSRLFNKAQYLKEVQAQKYLYTNPKEALERAQRSVDRFLRMKDFLILDLVELGKPAAEKLTKFLAGTVESDPRKIAAAPTRQFVAEAMAKIAEKEGDSDLAGKLRDMVGGSGSAAERAGASLALGALPRSMVGSSERDVLEKRGLSAGEAEIREAAATALAAVGVPENGAALAAVAADVAQQSSKEGVRAAVAALRAIAALKPKGNAEIVKKLASLVGHEPAAGQPTMKASSDLVREYACEALGEIGDPLAIRELGLVRGCRDSGVNVRNAASRAIAAILAVHGDVAGDLVKIMKDVGHKSDDRRGAALALESAGPSVIQALVTTLSDENPPIKMADVDPSVRAAACQTLGAMGAKAKMKFVGAALLEALGKDISEDVRAEAYAALKAISGDPRIPLFKPTDTSELRSRAAKLLNDWFSVQQGWKDQG